MSINCHLQPINSVNHSKYRSLPFENILHFQTYSVDSIQPVKSNSRKSPYNPLRQIIASINNSKQEKSVINEFGDKNDFIFLD